jgi:methyl coenzyme M reductase gamma subunit
MRLVVNIRTGETIGDPEFVPPLPPMPTKGQYAAAIEDLIHSAATAKGYVSGDRLATYVSSTDSQWAAEAAAFIAWRDAVWRYALSELDKVQSGLRAQPTIEHLVAELPSIEWPAAPT